MTVKDAPRGTADLKALVASDPDFVRSLMRTALQEVLEAEMTETVGAPKGARTEDRLGYRSGYYGRTLVTRVGKLELRVPQDRGGRFSTELFERYQRSERALVAALAEMYVQGVSTRKVKAITEELCGHSFSASSISTIHKRLDAGLAQFAGRRLEEPYPYLILDARYERIREAGVIRSQAVLIGERLVSPPLLIGFRRRSCPRRWARVSTAKGGHSFARIDAASAQVPSLERRGEALDLPGDESAGRVGGAGGAAARAERQPDLQVAQGSPVRAGGCARGNAGVLAGRHSWRRAADGSDGVSCSRCPWAGRDRPGDGASADRRRAIRCGWPG